MGWFLPFVIDFTRYSILVTHVVTRFHFTFRTKPSFIIKSLTWAAYPNTLEIIFWIDTLFLQAYLCCAEGRSRPVLRFPIPHRRRVFVLRILLLYRSHRICTYWAFTSRFSRYPGATSPLSRDIGIVWWGGRAKRREGMVRPQSYIIIWRKLDRRLSTGGRHRSY